MIPGWYSDTGKAAALSEQVTGAPGRAAEAVRIMSEQAAIEAAVTEIENETAAMREDAEQVAAYLAAVNAAIVSAYGIPSHGLARPAGSTCTCSAPYSDDYQAHPAGCPRRDELLMEIRAKLLACGPVLTAGAALTGSGALAASRRSFKCPGCGFWFSAEPPDDAGTTWPLPCCGYQSPAVTAAGTALTGGTAVYCTASATHRPGEPWACDCPPGSCKAREETAAQLNATPEENAALIRAVICEPLGLGEEDLPDYGVPGPLCCTGCLAPHAGDGLCWYCTRLQRLTLPPPEPVAASEMAPWSLWYAWNYLIMLVRTKLTRRCAQVLGFVAIGIAVWAGIFMILTVTGAMQW